MTGAGRGHLRAQLGKGRHQLVHRLVLTAFVGPCPDGMEACHNNGSPTDNRLCNLRWDTRRANQADKVLHGRSLRGDRNPLAKLQPSDIRRIRDLSREGVTGREIARRLNVTPANVSSILKGKTWNHIS